MIDVTLNTSDWDDFYDTFNKVWQPKAIEETKSLLVGDIASHFKEKGAYGRPWEAHTADYKIWMKRNGKVSKALLNQTGALINRMKQPTVTNLRGDGVRLVFAGKGKTAEYAHIHNNFPDGFNVKYPYGNTKIGSRKIAHRSFGWVSHKAEQQIINVWSNIR